MRSSPHPRKLSLGGDIFNNNLLFLRAYLFWVRRGKL